MEYRHLSRRCLTKTAWKWAGIIGREPPIVKGFCPAEMIGRGTFLPLGSVASAVAGAQHAVPLLRRKRLDWRASELYSGFRTGSVCFWRVLFGECERDPGRGSASAQTSCSRPFPSVRQGGSDVGKGEEAVSVEVASRLRGAHETTAAGDVSAVRVVLQHRVSMSPSRAGQSLLGLRSTPQSVQQFPHRPPRPAVPRGRMRVLFCA